MFYATKTTLLDVISN